MHFGLSILKTNLEELVLEPIITLKLKCTYTGTDNCNHLKNQQKDTNH